jgi:hypothetical protein
MTELQLQELADKIAGILEWRTDVARVEVMPGDATVIGVELTTGERCCLRVTAA